MIIIFLSATIIQMIIGSTIINDKITGWLDGESVLFEVFSVESFTNWQKEQFNKLSNLKGSGSFFKTIRDNNTVDLTAEDLFVGDILLITMEEIMAADLLLIGGNEIKIDISSLTGESKPVTKETYQNWIKKKYFTYYSIWYWLYRRKQESHGNYCRRMEHKRKIRRIVDNSKDITILQEKLEVLAKSISTFAILQYLQGS